MFFRLTHKIPIFAVDECGSNGPRPGVVETVRPVAGYATGRDALRSYGRRR